MSTNESPPSPHSPTKKQNESLIPGAESSAELRDVTNVPPKPRPKQKSILVPAPSGRNTLSENRTGRREVSEDITEERGRAAVQSRPVTFRLPSSDSDSEEGSTISKNKGKSKQRKEEEDQETWDEEDQDDDERAKAISQQSAQDRAERLSRMVGTHSAPGSRYTSPARSRREARVSPPPSPPSDDHGAMPLNLNDIPLKKLQTKRNKYSIEDETDDDSDDDAGKKALKGEGTRPKRFFDHTSRLFKQRASQVKPNLFRVSARAASPETCSGVQTPIDERDPDHYVPRPTEYREGVLSSLLRLYDERGLGSAIAHIPTSTGDSARAARRNFSSQNLLRTREGNGGADTPGQTPVTTPCGSPSSSGVTTPKPKHQKWYYKNPESQSTGALSDLVSSSTMMAQPGGSTQAARALRPKPKHRPFSHQALDAVTGKMKRSRTAEEYAFRRHVADVAQRHGFLLKMCRALMSYGAPTHRLEEYMRMCSRALEIDGQFLYIPGCMIISFDDRMTHTTEVKLVRATYAVDLGKLRDTHDVYKEVVHDVIGVEEAVERLESITHRRHAYPTWVRVIMYGLASLCVGPFAFDARLIDLPITFFLGCLVGCMQLVVAPRSDLYSNIFEVSAAVLTSFLARAFGSIRHGQLFCFSALAQSSIAMILPGYILLCGSLELQSRNIVAGSIRIVYAVIFSLFLGYGITIGTAFYGAMDKNATSDVSCRTTTPMWFKFIFVPPFTLCLVIINGARWKQMPIMVVIAFAGYIVNYFIALRFPGNTQIANTLGALAVGIMGNLYSRFRHGLAAAAMIPAIYVQVPSGLAASGSLVSGVTSANQITKHANGTGSGPTTISNASQGLDLTMNSMVFNVGFTMIQIAIGITVGLFLSALAVYPFGKRRSGLFSF